MSHGPTIIPLEGATMEEMDKMVIQLNENSWKHFLGGIFFVNLIAGLKTSVLAWSRRIWPDIFFFHAQVIKPLGAGQEVGRSCHLLEFKDKRILLDCGIHPGLSGKILNKRLVWNLILNRRCSTIIYFRCGCSTIYRYDWSW